MIQQIISNSYKKAKRIQLNSTSKFIFFSDVHRGDNSYADDFANNRNIYHHALRNYYENDFTYVELGDEMNCGKTIILKIFLKLIKIYFYF